MIKDGATRYVCDSRRRGYAGGKQEWFSTKDDALDRAREISDALVGGNTLTDEERSLFIYYRDALQPYGVTMKTVLEKALLRAQNKLERDEDEFWTPFTHQRRLGAGSQPEHRHEPGKFDRPPSAARPPLGPCWRRSCSRPVK